MAKRSAKNSIKKIGIITKHNVRSYLDYVKRVVGELQKHDVEILFDEHSAPFFKEEPHDKTKIMNRAHLVITLGGDGTLLKTARHATLKKPYIASVNMGHLGFLTAFTPKQFLKCIPRILKKDFREDERFLLRVTVYRNGKKRYTNLALNEAVINQGGFARLIHLYVEVNQRMLASYTADGLIISTPTGSTGHSLSAGGPIIHPKICGFLLTPLCPSKLGVRPLIIPNDRQITIKLETQWRAEKKPIVLTLDGQITMNLKKDDVIRVRTSRRTFNIIRMEGHNYYRMLRQKLNWGG